MVGFNGLNSVIDRTLFTDKGPIVKRALPVLAGSDLRILSPTDVESLSGSFLPSDAGFHLRVAGTPGGRNDGTFRVAEVLSGRRLRLAGASFSTLDEAATVQALVGLANDLKRQYNLHRTRKVDVGDEQEGVHGTDDVVNVVTASDAFDLPSAIVLLNDVRTQLGLHVQDVSGDPQVHEHEDEDDVPAYGASSALGSAIILANDLRRKYEAHRPGRFFHQHADLVDRVTVPEVKPVPGSFPGLLTGPFPWTLLDPLLGIVADDPYDVQVQVNGSPAAIDAVFGLLGAVVLSQKPDPTDSVTVDYDYLNNPPSRLLRLNSPEFNLNQAGNRGYAGLPQHRYRSRSFLIEPGRSPDFMSPYEPLKRGWKYKSLERAYTAALNDPTTLLLNVPTNKIAYPVLFERVSETTLRYDPATLPQNATDPWTLEGAGSFSLAPGGSALTIVDPSFQTGVDSQPPFFTHALEAKALSRISGAFRVRMSEDPSLFQPDGVFSGVAFGLSDGQRAAVAGLLLTDATNLTSAISMANAMKAAYNAHLVHVGSHVPDDQSESVEIVDATSLQSLVILVNEIRARYSVHSVKGGGPGPVHVLQDFTNQVLLPACSDLETAVSLVNELRQRFNAHRTQAGVHFSNDFVNAVGQVRQIGLLKSSGFAEFAESWQSVAVDWRDYRTFRVLLSPDGSASLFLSGDSSASATVAALDLPPLSALDGRFDPVRQAFFGSIGKESKNSSDWQFIRVNVQPVDSNLIENNKQVDYGASVVPELDPDAPWITYGQAGFERILSPGLLLLDSTASAAPVDVPALGLTSGAYRGFIRFEPILSPSTASVLEFRATADYYTQGLSNRAFCAVLDDGDFSVQFAFLQLTPSPATVTGTASEPFVLVTGDQLAFRVGDGPPVTVTFSLPPDVNTAAGVAAKINSVLGFPFASAALGKVKLTSQDSGASASFTIVSGSAMAKLGFSPGPYFGLDSNPEPKVSWFGANVPELDDPAWIRGGSQPAALLGRTLRTTDAASNDYVTYTVSDLLVTNQVFNPSVDWKLDVRLCVLSHDSGVPMPAAGPYQVLNSVGPLVSVDEGPPGKHLELHLSVSGSGDRFLNLLSFNPGTGGLDVMSQYAFDWDDAKVHTLNVFTSKALDMVMVLADGVVLPPFAGPAPTYSGLHQGQAGPQITFGTGSEPVAGADLRDPQSVVDWESVAVFRDSKIGDPSAASRRYVGIYKGGPADVLSSYYLHQVDWSVLHTYRIARDPTVGVMVYVDGGAVPVISAAYDVLSLPPASSSFLKDATQSDSVVAFGAFSPSEISRTRWDFVRYSIGRITLTDRLVPPHQVLNQGNVMASPDHLFTDAPHKHQGFRVYSGGTPIDEFMSDPSVQSFTELGEGTPPVPMTQDLESRLGLRKTGTPLDGVPAVDAVDVNGYLSDLIDDVVNVASGSAPSVPAATAQVVALANAVKTAYNAHRVQAGVHSVDDVVNVVAAPAAVDLPTSIVLLNDEKARYNDHLVEPGVHVPDDGLDEVTAPDAFDTDSAVALANDILQSYSAHLLNGPFHLAPDAGAVLDPDAVDLMSAVVLASGLVPRFSSHALSAAFHADPDLVNGSFSSAALGTGTGTGTVNGLNTLTTSAGLVLGALVQFLDGPNAGQARFVQTVNSATEFTVSPSFSFDDATGSRLVRMGSGTFVGTGSAPSTTDVSAAAPAVLAEVGDLVMFLDGPNLGQTRTVSSVASATDFSVAPPLLASDPVERQFALIRDPFRPATDPQAVMGVANLLRSRYLAHLVAPGVHVTDDLLDGIAVPAATTFAEAVPLLNAEKAAFNDHRDGFSFHQGRDLANAVGLPPAADPLQGSIAALNSVREAYLAHVVAPRVHLADDVVNVDLPPEASDLPSSVALANALKQELNAHLTATIRETQKVHTRDDVANAVVAPDAADLATLAVLSQAVLTAYNAHRVQPGVHGSSLFIRLDPPSRVLYEGMKFWTFDVGTSGVPTAPFSDDETLYFDGSISYGAPAVMSFLGDVLPEDDAERKTALLANDLKAVYNAHRTQSGVHVTNDVVNAVASPDATGLASAIVLLTELRSKFGSHLSQAGVHVATDFPDAPACRVPTDLASAEALAVELQLKYGAHGVSEDFHLVADWTNVVTAEDPPPAGDPGWERWTAGPGTASATLVTVGPVDAVRYATAGAGVRTAYYRRTGIPNSPSIRMEFTVKVRIGSPVLGPDGDTGIYAGITGSIGRGFAAAVGFDNVGGINYLKISDVRAGVALFRVPFDWSDGLFHTYRLVKDERTNAISVVIDD